MFAPLICLDSSDAGTWREAAGSTLPHEEAAAPRHLGWLVEWLPPSLPLPSQRGQVLSSAGGRRGGAC